ncbi:MAG TPA: M14 metallopeptidase family protein, partial [Longimicrobiales bacterium]|nr:M14 metallopeptidase family protein [Longimicrobiales bacterium]
MSGRRTLWAVFAIAGLATAPSASGTVAAQAASAVPTPQDFFGHEIGADYRLVDYDGLARYWEALAARSDRMVLDTIGTTQLGRPQLMAIVTSPANHARLDELREISARLGRARTVQNSAEAEDLAQRGRAVVWIDGGLHATETLGAQQLIESVFQFVSAEDEETLRILDDVVILFVHANPDGHALVADWYMREQDPEARSLSHLPVLYQHYAGHDNNRDFYMANLAETRNMNRVMYREWYPQIVYNHHQRGPRGTVMYAPPFRGPANYHMDPMILLGIDQVGSAMHLRFLAERKPGTVMRSAAGYSTWWNGGLRTAPYYHNMIGLLTETIGEPAPIEIPYDWDRYLQTNDTPLPIAPQTWRMRQSVDYSLTANYAVLDYAARNREHLLFNIWRMGRNAIEAGRTDAWTVYPHRWQSVREAV